VDHDRAGVAWLVHSGGSCLVEVKYHQHFPPNKSLGVQLYRTEPVAAMLPLDFPGWVEPLPAPRPQPLGAGFAGGVVAVRLGDLAVAHGVAGPV
jgi:hypothetical protein